MNLLDNWDFTNPVNQRGESTYTGGGYTIDRWVFDTMEASLKVVSDGVEVSGGGKQYSGIAQVLPNMRFVGGEVYTYSVLFKTLTPGWYIDFYILDGEEPVSVAGTYELSKNGSNIILSTTITIPKRVYGENAHLHVHICNRTINANKCIISAAKLELGEVSTLKNDVLGVSYAEELRKCQRYYQRFTSKAEYTTISGTTMYGNLNAFLVLLLPVSMRTMPSIAYKNVVAQMPDMNVAISGLYSETSVYIGKDIATVKLNVALSANRTVGELMLLNIQNGGYIELSADL